VPVFDMIATFPTGPPTETEPQRFYVIADTPAIAVRQLVSQGGTDVWVVRRLTEFEARQFRFLRGAEV
jgi:hypothetical protein